MLQLLNSVCVGVRACVRACVRVRVRACVHMCRIEFTVVTISGCSLRAWSLQLTLAAPTYEEVSLLLLLLLPPPPPPAPPRLPMLTVALLLLPAVTAATGCNVCD